MQIISFVKNKRNIRTVAVVALILITLLAILNGSAIHRQLDVWKLLPQPERLTELYYAEHAKLPTTYTAGVPQQFTFITHNLEYQETGYSYTVAQESEDGTQHQTLANGSFRLITDTIGTTPITFTPTEMGKHTLIVTTLTNTSTHVQQSIHYWLTNTNQVTPVEGGGA